MDALTDSLQPLILLPRMGTATPWNIATDSVTSSLLLASAALTLIAVGMGAPFLLQRIKGCTAPQGSRMAAEASATVVTAGERWRSILYHLLLSLSAGMLFTAGLGMQGCGWHTFHPVSPWQMPVTLAAVCMAVLVLRRLLYTWLHATFFTPAERTRWAVAYRLSTGFEATLLTVCSLAAAGNTVATENVLLAAVLIVFLAKAGLMWCAYRMFFGNMFLSLHFFAYLCSAEMIPLAVMWQAMRHTAQWLVS